jgi:hypothetical protein
MTAIMDDRINQVAVQRITTQEDAAAEAGFSPVQTWFAVGTELIDVGRQKFQQSRVSYDALPEARVALPAFIDQIEGEQRIDYDISAHEALMNPEGALLWRDREFRLTPESFGRLVSHTLPRGCPQPTAYWRELAPKRRAKAVNDALLHSTRGFKLRTRLVDGVREAYSVVGPRYTAVDANLLAHTLLQQVEPDTKTVVLYRGTRATIDFIWHTDIDAGDVAVGEHYKAAQRITTDDDGTEAIRGIVSLFRAICINLTTVSADQSLFRRRHVGAVDTVLQTVVAGHEVGQEKLREFLVMWNRAKLVDLRTLVHARHAARFHELTPRNIVRHLFLQEGYRIPGVSASAVAEAAEQAWFKEGEDWSVVGVSNALTRAAHEAAWNSPAVEEQLQNVGGRLVVAPRDVPWGVWTPDGSAV